MEALEGHHTISEISTRYSVHPYQVSRFKMLAAERLPELFSDRRSRAEAE